MPTGQHGGGVDVPPTHTTLMYITCPVGDLATGIIHGGDDGHDMSNIPNRECGDGCRFRPHMPTTVALLRWAGMSLGQWDGGMFVTNGHNTRNGDAKGNGW